MSHRSLFWPITLIVIVAATMVMVITSASVDPHAVVVSAAVTCPTDGTNPAYPDCVKTEQATTASPAVATVDLSRILSGCPTEGPAHVPAYPPYAQCLQTRTAILAQTERAGATATSPPSNNSQPADTATPTSTFTSTPTLTITAVASAIAQATSTLRPTPSATPTATLADSDQAAIDATACIPGDVIVIEGSADPEIALIVTFGDRPVGGGFTRNDGSYRIRLRIGDERPGIYPVQVQERTTRNPVQEFNCQVPALTPTPTLPLIP
jgi:hypothetical protein